MNVWRRGPLLENPYYRTAFRMARVPAEVVRRATLVQMMGNTRRLVRASPDSHTIQGRPVTEAEINTAEAVLLDARQRVLEELLEHAEEMLPLDQVRQLTAEVAAALRGDDAGPLEVENIAGLAPLLDVVAREYLKRSPAGHPSFGALELELVPPYGRPDESQA